MPSWQAKPARGTVRDRHSGLPWMPHEKATLPATEVLSWVFRIIRARVGRAALGPLSAGVRQLPCSRAIVAQGARAATGTHVIVLGGRRGHLSEGQFLQPLVQKHSVSLINPMKVCPGLVGSTPIPFPRQGRGSGVTYFSNMAPKLAHKGS